MNKGSYSFSAAATRCGYVVSHCGGFSTFFVLWIMNFTCCVQGHMCKTEIKNLNVTTNYFKPVFSRKALQTKNIKLKLINVIGVFFVLFCFLFTVFFWMSAHVAHVYHTLNHL